MLTNLSNYDSDVLIDFAYYYGLSLIIWAFLVALISAIGRKHIKIARETTLFRFLSIGISSSLLVWCVYFLLTSRWYFTELSLDAEDPKTAEYAYWRLFSVDLDEAIRLAIDDRRWQTVRFYAACRAGELLGAKNDEGSLRETMKRVEDAPLITPVFFGTNAINNGLFVPGTIAGPYRVSDVISENFYRSTTKAWK